MGLPKELKRALQAKLKDGESLPDEFDDCVYFPNEGAALAFAEAKNKGKLSAANDAASEAAARAKALETQLTDVLKGIGIESADKLDEFKTKFAEAQGSLTEVDKLRAAIKDKDKEIGKLTASNTELGGFKVQVLKDKAIEPHLKKFKVEFQPIVRENILGKLSIDEKGKVTAPEGKEIDVFVEGILKETPALKAPEFKEGAGTGPGGGKTNDKGTEVGAGNGGASGGSNGQNGQPMSMSDKLRADFEAAQAAQQ